MKLAVTAEGTRGDIHPMLALAERLEAHGHEVVFCAPPDFADAAFARGLSFCSVGRDIREFLTAEASSLHGSALGMARAASQLMQGNLRRQFAELLAAAEGCEGILSAGTQIAASSIAEHLGIPHRFIAYDPTLFRSEMHPPVFCRRPNLPRWVNRALWRLQGGTLRLAMGGAVNRERTRLDLAPARDLYGLIIGRNPLLAAEERIAPIPPDVETVRSIGCLHPFAEEALPEKLEAFLDAGPPPVYIGFGSMTDPDPDRSTLLLLDAIERAEVRAIVSEGWAGLGGVALPSHVAVAGVVDHSTLFQRVAAVIHHGGAGTTTMAARSGAPQILVPHVLDQFHWAARIQGLGVGPPPLARRKLTADGLAHALRATCDNEWLTDNAARLGEQLRNDLAERRDPVEVML
jgi:UDP:flavonoid glycosyltransferase YjiC (YdhE family)